MSPLNDVFEVVDGNEGKRGGGSIHGNHVERGSGTGPVAGIGRDRLGKGDRLGERNRKEGIGRNLLGRGDHRREHNRNEGVTADPRNVSRRGGIGTLSHLRREE